MGLLIRGYRHISGTTEEEVEFGISGPAKANEEQNDISESASTLKPKSQSATHSEESNDEKQENKEPAQAQKSADPIRWFGILVPQSLRAAQASFVSSIEGPIPALVNIARNLRSQEIEIGRVRKAIKKL